MRLDRTLWKLCKLISSPGIIVYRGFDNCSSHILFMCTSSRLVNMLSRRSLGFILQLSYQNLSSDNWAASGENHHACLIVITISAIVNCESLTALESLTDLTIKAKQWTASIFSHTYYFSRARKLEQELHFILESYQPRAACGTLSRARPVASDTLNWMFLQLWASYT